MTHDFAKIRPEPLLEKKPAQTPPAWSMMFTGILVGAALGVFGCVLFYMSGQVPPLTNDNVAGNAPNPQPAAAVQTPASDPLPAEEEALRLEFYTELPSYEVSVDAVPVHVASPEDPLPVPYMLQTGAFQQRSAAEQEVRRQQTLGLNVLVKTQQLTGRTLYLVQSGPYRTHGQLDDAERILRRNNIPALRTSIQ